MHWITLAGVALGACASSADSTSHAAQDIQSADAAIAWHILSAGVGASQPQDWQATSGAVYQGHNPGCTVWPVDHTSPSDNNQGTCCIPQCDGTQCGFTHDTCGAPVKCVCNSPMLHAGDVCLYKDGGAELVACGPYVPPADQCPPKCTR